MSEQRSSKTGVSAETLKNLREMAYVVAVKGKLLIELLDEIERLTAETTALLAINEERWESFVNTSDELRKAHQRGAEFKYARNDWTIVAGKLALERDRLRAALKWAQQDAIARGHYGTAEMIGAALRPADETTGEQK